MSSPSWTIAIGCDSAGTDYKEILKADLEKDKRVKGVIDVGVSKNGGDLDTDYPHIGVAAAREVSEGRADRALLICGTGGSYPALWRPRNWVSFDGFVGMGVAISANKVVSLLHSIPY